MTVKRIFALMLFGFVSATAQDSRLGTFRAECTIEGGAQAAGEVNRLTTTVFDAQGDVVYRLTTTLAYDIGPPAVGVFETGSCVLLDSFHGILKFYDNRGALVRTLSLLKDAEPEYERLMPFAVHDHFILLAVSEPSSPVSRAFQFTAGGDLLYETNLEGDIATGVVIANSGTLGAVGTGRWGDEAFEQMTTLISSSGAVEALYPVGSEFGAFAEDEATLFVTTRTESALLSVPDRTIISRSPALDGTLLLDVTTSRGAFFLLSASVPSLVDGQWRYTSPSVERIDPDGKRREVLADPQRNFGTARLKGTAEGVTLEIDGIDQPLR
jgi:hypothetical protein